MKKPACLECRESSTGQCARHRAPLEPPAHGDLIGKFTNDWRKRIVMIYAHPSDPALVVTCGAPYPGHGNDPIWTTEPRADFAPYIGRFDRIYE